MAIPISWPEHLHASGRRRDSDCMVAGLGGRENPLDDTVEILATLLISVTL